MAQNYTATTANVTATTTTTTLFATAPSGVSARTVFNDSAAVLYLKFGTGASTSSYTTQVAAGGYYEVPGPGPYGGPITGVWGSATGTARVTEVA